MGSHTERIEGRRLLHFNESLSDVCDDVDSCLVALPHVVDVMVENNWCPKICQGFSIITQLILEAGAKTIKALEVERKILKHENQQLQKCLSQCPGEE